MSSRFRHRQTTQIARIEKKLGEIEAARLDPVCVPIYDGESEADALADYRQTFGACPAGRVAFNRARPGDTRGACKRSGMHSFYCLGSASVRKLMGEVDGITRGPVNR